MPHLKPGDRVQLVGNAHGPWMFDQLIAGAPVLVVQHQMPHEADCYMLSDGTVRRDSELHLVERAGADVELEHVALNDGRIHTRLAAPKAAE